MKVLLDTNIILDALMERSPFDTSAKEILKHAQSDKSFICLLTANAATDIFYLYSKARDVQTAKTALNFLLTQYNVVSVTQEDCINALSIPIDDFEDALVVVCAQKADADYIVTRDKKFINTTVKAISPNDLITILHK